MCSIVLYISTEDVINNTVTFVCFSKFVVLIVLFVGFVHALGWRLVLKYVGIYFIIYLVIMSPWWMHQYQKYGEFVRLNLADGIVLYSGNNPLNKTGGGIVGSDVDMSSFNNEINRGRTNMIDCLLHFFIVYGNIFFSFANSITLGNSKM